VTAGLDPAAGGLVGDGAWLELSVACDLEAVEAVAEILFRVAPGGVEIEPGLSLVDEGLGATVDPAAPATVRAHLPARDAAAARAAIATVEQALGHLAAFGLRPIGELETRVIHESDWAGAWKRHLGILRIGHGIVIRPSWRRHRRRPGETVVAMDPGMAFGTGLHPTTRLCLVAIERWAGEGRLARGGARDGRARLLDVGCGSGILGITACLLGAGGAMGIDTDPLAVEVSRANARRNRVARRLRARHGSLPTAAGPFDLVAANLVASLLVDLAGALAAELAPDGRLVASGIFVDREADVRQAFESAGLAVVRRDTEGDWVALEAQSSPDPPRRGQPSR
jgi:ribosomal protein L11 methyltransferase